MKIAVTPLGVKGIEGLSANGADIFLIGNSSFGNRLVYSFSTIEITNANNLIKSLNKEIYIVMNYIVHNANIKSLKEFLDFVKELDVDGIIFGDLAVYQLAKKIGIEDKLIYSPETLNTNYYDPIFWSRQGIKGLTISKEITLEDIKQISKDKVLEISLIGHGHLNMFHSRRPLIENFFKYTNQEYKDYIENRNLRVVEEIRNESYPIFQDNHGTHIFRDKSLESFQEVNILNDYLDVFIIDGIFKDNRYLEEALKHYKELLNNKGDAKSISKLYEGNHDSGFLYKKTVYDK
ncbi:MAG: Peptidase family U32 [Candidatus Izimaplasma bacterium HR2]|nr:MAG: Peptidase family U32 [Candidatus Izimaplasma bacterium HR2]